ncbi:hypothetical protein WJX73_000454 [Symbiochloris irregularis]|uniref:Uncharacterized protein n=1 Tax=Symbiochloris irregularis TaxID=706552 RepID=A0AAW1NGG4_9CHLO
MIEAVRGVVRTLYQQSGPLLLKLLDCYDLGSYTWHSLAATESHQVIALAGPAGLWLLLPLLATQQAHSVFPGEPGPRPEALTANLFWPVQVILGADDPWARADAPLAKWWFSQTCYQAHH